VDDRTLLVVGLGNPGPQYAGTRHNVGQMALDVLADRMRASFRSHRANAQVAEGRAIPGGPKLILAKPNSFMNLSGGPVAGLLKYFSLEPAQLVVAHDELDIPFDAMKLKQGGGHGGHNGIRDIISSTERQVLPNVLEDAADAIEMIAADGLIAAQLRFHTAAS
jgi:PTH1 family peptidyl-tRNA hydrolase